MMYATCPKKRRRVPHLRSLSRRLAGTGRLPPDRRLILERLEDRRLLAGAPSPHGLFPNETIPVGGWPEVMAIGDLNGDSWPDLVAANSADDTVAVVLGTGDGRFAAAVTYATGDGPTAVAVGDLNGDSRPDIVTANLWSDDVSVLLNDGNGSFLGTVSYAVPFRAQGVKLADVNEDDVFDVVAATSSAGICILLGNGDGTLASYYELPSGSYFLDLDVGDLNDDQHVDIVVARNDNYVLSYLGNGDGTFVLAGESEVGDWPWALTLVDVGGDGVLDVATANQGDGTLSVLAGNRDGTFGTVTTYPLGVNRQPISLVAADLNGNGVPEIIVANEAVSPDPMHDRTMAVLVGQPDGTFAEPVHYHYPAYHVEVGDLNQDGAMDVATLFTSGVVLPIFGDGSATFADQLVYPLGDNPMQTALGDLNGDGILDVVAVNSGLLISQSYAGTVSVRLGQGDGTFEPPTFYAVGRTPRRVALGDVNHDDILDIVAVNYYSYDETASVLLGVGDGTFRVQTTYPVGQRPIWVIVEDLNHDGASDIVTANSLENRVSVLLARGDGTFSPQIKYAVGGRPYVVLAADFNNDGHLDLATANNVGDSISVLLGVGNGTFQPQVAYLTIAMPDSLAAGDLNEDGICDLLVFSPSTRQLEVLLGVGNGTFVTGSSTTYPRLSQSRAHLADVNADQLLDLVISGYSGVLVYTGAGDGSFSANGASYATAGDSEYLAVGDLNRDGLMDLVATDFYERHMTVLVNAGAIRHTPSGQTDGPVSALQLQFPVSMDTTSFSLLDDIVRFRGPDGALNVLTHHWLDSQTLVVEFPPVNMIGRYELVFGPRILDTRGQPLDTDRDGISGEPFEDLYVASFLLRGPRILRAENSSPRAVPLESIRVVFDRAIDPTTFTAVEDILALSSPGGPVPVTGITWKDAATAHIHVAPQQDEGTYELRLGSQIADPSGNLLDQDGDFVGGEQPDDEFSAQLDIAYPVVSGDITQTTNWSGGPIVVDGQLRVHPGATLVIGAGTIVKFRGADSGLNIEGALLILGTSDAPVILTSIRDDTAGGDTNEDGAATSPAAGDWRWLHLDVGSTDSLIQHTRIRYAGGNSSGTWSGTAAIRQSTTSPVTIENTIVSDAFYDGFLGWGRTATIRNSVFVGTDRAITAHPSSDVHVVNCTLDDNRIGLLLHGGSLEVSNTLVTNSITAGVLDDFGGTFAIRNSDVWNPQATLGNYVNRPDATGADGNISADPQYFHAANRQFQLRPGSPAVDAGTSSDAPVSDLLAQPRYDDPWAANVGSGSDPWYDMGAYERHQQHVSPLDLSATNVTGPSAGMQDDLAWVQWSVLNQGTEAASGQWYDAVYLSPDRVWSADDLWLGEASHVGDLGAGQSYTATVAVPLPGVLPGDYYFIVRPNNRHELAEGAGLLNNAGASVAPVSMDLPELILGTPATVELPTTGAEKYFKLNSSAGTDLGLALEGPNGATNHLYARHGRLPTPYHFDARGVRPGSADQWISLPGTRAGVYYVLVEGDDVPAPEVATLTATEESFAISGVSPNQGSRQGTVTLHVTGAQFTPSTAVRLIDSQGQPLDATSRFFTDTGLVSATFDLNTAALGLADVELADDVGTVVSLPDAFEVTDTAGGELAVDLIVPASVRLGRDFEIQIQYTNTGGTDLYAPLLSLTSSAGTVLGLEKGLLDSLRQLDLLAVSHRGPAGILPPGAGGMITVYGQAKVDQVQTITLTTLRDDAAAPPWTTLESVLRPPGLDDGQWQPVFARMQTEIGPTWYDFHQTLAEVSSWLPPRLGRHDALANVAQLEYERVVAQLNTSVAGHLVLHGTAQPLSNVEIELRQPITGELYWTASLNDGSFLFPQVIPGTYQLVVPGMTVLNAPPELVVDATGVADLDLHVGFGVTVAGQVVSADSGAPVLDAVVAAVGADGAELLQFIARTGADGRYRFESLPPGAYELRASGVGYVSSLVAGLTLDEQDPRVRVDFTLPTAGTISGQVTGPAGPIFGAVVAAWGVEGRGASTTTDENGEFRLDELPLNQTFDVSASAADCVRAEQPGLLLTNAAPWLDVDLTLTAAGVLQGTVTQADDGLPLSGVEVHVVSGNSIFVTTSAADGRYMFAELPARLYEVTFVSDVFMTETALLDVPAAVTTTLNQALVPRGAIRGSVTQSGSGAPVSKVVVHAVTGEQLVATVTDIVGAYELTGLQAGSYRVVLGDEGTIGLRSANVVLDRLNREATVDFEFPIEGMLGGTVFAAGGITPLAAVQVALTYEQQIVATMATDELGAYAFVIAAAGEYGVEALAPQMNFTPVPPQLVSGGSQISGLDFVAGQDVVAGLVSDAVTADPVAGAEILLIAANPALVYPLIYDIFTAADGTFAVSHLLPGDYTAYVTAAGYAQASAPVSVTAGVPAQLPLSLTAECRVQGVVADAMTGLPVEGAVVRLISTSAPEVGSGAVAGLWGDYDVGGLPAGTYDVLVTAEGYEALMQPGVAIAGATSQLDLVLGPPTTFVSGTVTSAGRALEGVLLTFVSDAGLWIATAFSAADGTYSLPQLPPGQYEVSAQASGYRPATAQQVSVVAGQVLSDVDFVLVPVAVSDPDATSAESSSLTWPERLGLPEQYQVAIPEPFEVSPPCRQQLYFLEAAKSIVDEKYQELRSYRQAREGDLMLVTNAVVGLKWAEGRARQEIGRQLPVLEEAARSAKYFGAQDATAVVTEAHQLLTDLRNTLTRLVSALDTARLNVAETHINVLLSQIAAAEGLLREPIISATIGSKLDSLQNRLSDARNFLQQTQGVLAPTKEFLKRKESYLSSENALRRAEEKLDRLRAKYPKDWGVLDIAPLLLDQWDRFFRPKKSVDPNDKIGPSASDPGAFLQPGNLPYEIHFENDPDAGATIPAQEVSVTDTLDAHLDLNTFQFGAFGFSNMDFPVPPGLSRYETRLDLRAYGIDLLVDVELALAPATRTVSATFRSLDPLTWALPDDVDAGFLPVNDKSLHNGEGYFRYSVQPLAGLPTGTAIANQASIIFDVNAPLLTPATLHVLDAAPPASNVSALPGTVAQDFRVAWQGVDDAGGSGVTSYDVYVADNGGWFTPWLLGTTDTSATFRGVSGHRYAFYSLATDVVGHRELAPAVADATTLLLAYRNPLGVYDVSGGNGVTLYDAVLIVRFLARNGAVEPFGPAPPYVDVAAPDNLVTLQDAIALLRYLARGSGEPEPSSPNERPASAVLVSGFTVVGSDNLARLARNSNSQEWRARYWSDAGAEDFRLPPLPTSAAQENVTLNEVVQLVARARAARREWEQTVERWEEVAPELSEAVTTRE